MIFYFTYFLLQDSPPSLVNRMHSSIAFSFQPTRVPHSTCSGTMPQRYFTPFHFLGRIVKGEFPGVAAKVPVCLIYQHWNPARWRHLAACLFQRRDTGNPHTVCQWIELKALDAVHKPLPIYAISVWGLTQIEELEQNTYLRILILCSVLNHQQNVRT